jgi:hypothetical protein
MSEEKRPVLSLKRKPATDNAGANNNTGTLMCGAPQKSGGGVDPPAWKVKKEKLEKKAAEAAARKLCRSWPKP